MHDTSYWEGDVTATGKLFLCNSLMGVVLVGGVSCFLDQGHLVLVGVASG